MLKISFRSAPLFIEQMKKRGPQIVQVLMSGITRQMFLLASYVQQQKLSGQVLTPRSGTLRGSVTAFPATLEGTRISGRVESSGGPAFYGKFAEYGVPHMWEIHAVKARALSFILGSKRRFYSSVVHSELKQRAFMQPSLNENAEKIVSALNESVNRVINEP